MHPIGFFEVFSSNIELNAFYLTIREHYSEGVDILNKTDTFFSKYVGNQIYQILSSSLTYMILSFTILQDY